MINGSTGEISKQGRENNRSKAPDEILVGAQSQHQYNAPVEQRSLDGRASSGDGLRGRTIRGSQISRGGRGGRRVALAHGGYRGVAPGRPLNSTCLRRSFECTNARVLCRYSADIELGQRHPDKGQNTHTDAIPANLQEFHHGDGEQPLVGDLLKRVNARAQSGAKNPAMASKGYKNTGATARTRTQTERVPKRSADSTADIAGNQTVPLKRHKPLRDRDGRRAATRNRTNTHVLPKSFESHVRTFHKEEILDAGDLFEEAMDKDINK